MKTALISGGTSGIGLSIAKALLKINYMAYIIGSNKSKGKNVEAELNKLYPGQIQFILLDLSNISNVKKFAADFSKEHKTLDLLVNTAGIMTPKRIITDEGFEMTFAVNYLSAFILSTELAPLLSQAEHGRIANVSGARSMVFKAKLDFDDLTFSKNYGAFKTAIISVHAKMVLSEILAKKYADKSIDVISFNPGAVKSSLMKNMNWWLKIPLSFINLFMNKETKTGIYVCSSPELNGVSGKYFEKSNKYETLSFDKKYKQKLLSISEDLTGVKFNL